MHMIVWNIMALWELKMVKEWLFQVKLDMFFISKKLLKQIYYGVILNLKK